MGCREVGDGCIGQPVPGYDDVEEGELKEAEPAAFVAAVLGRRGSLGVGSELVDWRGCIVVGRDVARGVGAGDGGDWIRRRGWL